MIQINRLEQDWKILDECMNTVADRRKINEHLKKNKKEESVSGGK